MNVSTHLTSNAPNIDAAYDACRRFSTSSYENFNVVSRFIRRPLRRHFYSVYAFCRLVDYLGDEIDGDRSALLDRWETELKLCYGGSPNLVWFQALQRTIQEFEIPAEPFLRLIEANRRDQTQVRHENFDSLLAYCTYSATPVGQIILQLYRYRSQKMIELSNYTCTALQLANFWQDVSRDFDKGRIYIPISDMNHYGIDESMIRDRDANAQFRALMKFQVDRTRDLFRAGYELQDHLIRGFKLEFSAITAGGLSVLDAIEKLDYDTLSLRPTVSRTTKLKIMFHILVRRMVGATPIPHHAFSTSNPR